MKYRANKANIPDILWKQVDCWFLIAEELACMRGYLPKTFDIAFLIRNILKNQPKMFGYLNIVFGKIFINILKTAYLYIH
jgi:hypothetical protein